MKFKAFHIQHFRARAGGYTLIELVVCVGLSIILLAIVAMLFINGSQSFVAMGNYQDLDVKSTAALDSFSKEIRNATAVVGYTNGVSLTLTNSAAGTCTILRYDSTARVLVMSKTGQTDKTNLTGCDSWSFTLYNRIPSFSSTNITFSVTNAANCKLVGMKWKCSRTILGSKLNTESVQTAQVMLRNKVN